MGLPFCSLLDPVPQQDHLIGGEAHSVLFGRHPLGLIGRGDAAIQLALLRLAGDEGSTTAQVSESPGLGVQAQVRLAASLVGPVTGEASVGQDGPDVAVELNRTLGGPGRAERSKPQQAGKRQQTDAERCSGAHG